MTLGVCVCLCLLATLMLIPRTLGEEVEREYASEGHVFQLHCYHDPEENVTWTRGYNQTSGLEVIGHNQTLDAAASDLEVRDGSLWFLPARAAHSGYYTCEVRETGSWVKTFLSVGSGPCPPVSRNVFIRKKIRQYLTCGQEHIFELDTKANVSWLKDCSPIDQHEKNLRFLDPMDSDAGNYTCLLNFSHGGREYTASETTLFSITEPGPVWLKPQVMHPRNETVQVEPGLSAVLVCRVLVGMNGAETETLIYWKVNHSFMDVYKQLNNSLKYEQKGKMVYGVSTLFISEVRPEFLYVPFRCIVQNPAGRDTGTVWLTPANHSGYYCVVALGLVLPVVILAVLLCWLFKVDLVLAYRRLRPHLGKQISDGKLYDAYVSYLHGDELCSSTVMTFALSVLPEVLERRHGYKLFISGRDDLPGEAVHDVIAETIRKSRRLIIVLSSGSGAPTDREDQTPLSLPGGDMPAESHTAIVSRVDHKQRECQYDSLDRGERERQYDSLDRGEQERQDDSHDPGGQERLYESLAVSRLDYEQRVGLYDSLVPGGLQLILVQAEGHVDTSLLPASLRYVSSKQGVLRWSPSRHNNTVTSNTRFWKNLRYHMPPEGRSNSTTDAVAFLEHAHTHRYTHTHTPSSETLAHIP